MHFGLISDTHLPGKVWELWPQVAVAFRGVDAILHAGDIVSLRVLDWLERIAPVLAAEGNHDDSSSHDLRVKKKHVFQVGSFHMGLIHIFEPPEWGIEQLLDFYFSQALDLVVFGDTHQELAEVREGVLLVNPGSPTYPHNMEARLGTIGFLEVDGPNARAEIYQLNDSTRLRLVTSAALSKVA